MNKDFDFVVISLSEERPGLRLIAGTRGPLCYGKIGSDIRPGKLYRSLLEIQKLNATSKPQFVSYNS